MASLLKLLRKRAEDETRERAEKLKSLVGLIAGPTKKQWQKEKPFFKSTARERALLPPKQPSFEGLEKLFLPYTPPSTPLEAVKRLTQKPETKQFPLGRLVKSLISEPEEIKGIRRKMEQGKPLTPKERQLAQQEMIYGVADIAAGVKKVKTPKLKIGGGQFAMERFNVADDVDDLIRKTAKKIEPSIKKARRGVVSWEQTMKDAEKISIAQLLDRKRGKGVSDAYVAATANHIKSLSDEIDALRKQPMTPMLKKEIARRITLFKALTAKTFGASAEAGRALKAHQLLAQELAEPRQQLISQVLKDAKEWGNADAVVDQLMKFAPEDKQGMINFLAEVKPSDPIEKIEAIWYNNILSNPATNLANTIGNTNRSLWHLATKPFRVGFDVAQSKLKGTPREEFIREWGPECVGALKGFKDGVRRAVFALKSGYRIGDVEDLRIPRKALKGKIGAAYSLPSRGLIAMDEMFRGINRSMDIYRGAYNEAIKEGLEGAVFNRRVAELIQAPTPKMVKSADKIAEELLFQKMSTELRAAGGLRDFAKFDVPKLGTVRPLKFAIPFITTPINVAKFGVEVTPLGVAATAMQGAEKLGQREFSRRMASGALGSAIATTLAIYVAEDKITGRAPRDTKEKDAFYAEGKQPYSAKIGDRWVQYSRIDPIATWLTTLANWHDNFNETNELPTTDKIQNFAMGIGRGFADKTFLTGLGDLMDAIEDPERYGGSYLKRLASSLSVPWSSLTGAMARATDRTVRRPETLRGALFGKLPFLASQVPARESEFEEGGVARRKAPGWQEFIPTKVTKEQKVPEVGVFRETKALRKEAKKRTEAEQEKAEQIWSEIGHLESKEKIKRFYQLKKEGVITKSIHARLKDLKKAEQRNWTASEKRIYNLDSVSEARYHFEKIKGLSKTKQREYLMNLIKRGLFTRQTAVELKKLMKEK